MGWTTPSWAVVSAQKVSWGPYLKKLWFERAFEHALSFCRSSFFLLRLQHGNLKRHGRLVMFNTLWLTGLQGFAYLCWICLKVQLIRYENCIDWFLDHGKTVLQRSSVSLRSTYLLIFTYNIYIYISPPLGLEFSDDFYDIPKSLPKSNHPVGWQSSHLAAGAWAGLFSTHGESIGKKNMWI